MRWLESSRFTATGAVQIGLQAVAYLQEIMLLQEDNLMSLASMNSTAPAEVMIATALILVAAAVRVMRNWLRRLSQSRLILQTDSFDLTLQTKPPSSLQGSQQQPQREGDDEDGNSNNDHRGVSEPHQRTHF